MDSEDAFGFPFPPYDVQKELMQALTEAIDERAIGFFESPTGTGKTLSIICASLTWLMKHRLDPSALDPPSFGAEATSENSLDNPDWVNAQATMRDICALEQLNMKRVEQYQKRLQSVVREDFKHKSRRAKVRRLGGRVDPTGKAKRGRSQNLAPQHDPLAGQTRLGNSCDEFADTEGGGDLFRNADVEEDFDADTEPRLRIIFASRTHSQLAQFISEFRRTKFAPMLSESLPPSGTGVVSDVLPISLMAFGSRKHMCINDSVRKLSSASAVSERCRELLSEPGSSTLSGGAKRRADASGKACGCPFKNADAERHLRDVALVRPRDVEELVTLGKDVKGCPYFASRAALESGALDVVAVPYSALFHGPTRQSLGLQVDSRTVVILDEAHNIVEAVADLHSAAVSACHMLSVRYALAAYKDKYDSRLSGKSMFFVKQTLSLVDGLLKLLSGLQQSEANESRSRVVSLSELVFEAKIDNLNLFTLATFFRDSRLCHKLIGFIDSASGSAATAADADAQGGLNELSLVQVQRRHKQSIAAFDGFLQALISGGHNGRVAVYPAGTGASLTSADKDGYLKFFLLNPGELFAATVRAARAILLLGGTLTPKESMKRALLSGFHPSRPVRDFECGHVVPKANLLVHALARGPSGVSFEFTHKTRNNVAVLDDLGNALIALASSSPGGIVMFFASYSFLTTVIDRWSSTSCASLLREKKPFFVETRGDTSVFDEYAAAVRENPTRGAVIGAVLGGKLSEGINFSDELGRLVLVVGMPFANARNVETAESLRALPDARHRAEHLENSCMTVVNQAIGRAIRHKGDYASIVLCDRRFCKRRTVAKLPRFVRESVRPTESFVSLNSSVGQFFKTHG